MSKVDLIVAASALSRVARNASGPDRDALLGLHQLLALEGGLFDLALETKRAAEAAASAETKHGRAFHDAKARAAFARLAKETKLSALMKETAELDAANALGKVGGDFDLDAVETLDEGGRRAVILSTLVAHMTALDIGAAKTRAALDGVQQLRELLPDSVKKGDEGAKRAARKRRPGMPQKAAEAIALRAGLYYRRAKGGSWGQRSRRWAIGLALAFDDTAPDINPETLHRRVRGRGARKDPVWDAFNDVERAERAAKRARKLRKNKKF